jgi:hypothetical protein
LKALKELLKLIIGAPQGWDWEFYFSLCLQRAYFQENNLKLVYEIFLEFPEINQMITAQIFWWRDS